MTTEIGKGELLLQEMLELGVPENEIEELKTRTYDDYWTDVAIERVKEYDSEMERLVELGKQRIDKIKADLDVKIKRLEKRKMYELIQIQNAVLLAEDKKETKTQFKKSFVSGDVIIKKESKQLVKPELEEEQIKKHFPDFVKEKAEVKLDWAELKKTLNIQQIDGAWRVFDANGEDVTELVAIQTKESEVKIK